MKYRCVTDLAKLQDYLSGARLVAFDFETAPREEYRRDEKAALDAHKADIVGVSFSISEGTAVYVPLRHKTGKNAGSPDKVMQWLVESVFENKEIVKIAHNLSFEAMFLYALGIVLQPPCYDTIAAAQMTLKSNTAFRTLADSGLKTLAQELCGAELPSFETVTAGRYFDELDPQDEETVRYACADSDYTLRLHHLFSNWFDRYLPKHRLIVEKLESPAAVYCGLMKHNGLLAGKELMLKKQAEAEAKLAELRDNIAFMTGDVNIGANASTSAFKKYLYEDLKLPVFKTTAKYQEAMDDEAMILFSEWCCENRPELAALFELVQEYRRWGKIKSTYIDGYLEHINSVTGRIHPDLFPLSTETGALRQGTQTFKICRGRTATRSVSAISSLLQQVKRCFRWTFPRSSFVSARSTAGTSGCWKPTAQEAISTRRQHRLSTASLSRRRRTKTPGITRNAAPSPKTATSACSMGCSQRDSSET